MDMGIAVLVLLVLAAVLALAAPLLVERIVVREFRELNFPTHTLNAQNLGAFLVSVEPRARVFLTKKRLQSMAGKIREQHRSRVQAAVKGIESDDQAADYMRETGILDQLRLSREQALNLLKAIDPCKSLLKPKSGAAEFYPSTIPPHPVRLPAEHEKIGAVIVSWPLFYPRCWKAHADLVREISTGASALVIVRNQHWQKAVELYLGQSQVKSDRIRFLQFPTDDVWTRDYGPAAVFAGPDQSPIFIWNPYSIAGQAYYKFDADAAACLAATFGIQIFRLPLVVEGGNLISDGKGTILMFDSVLAMNPDLDRGGLEKILAEFFGCKRLLLLPALPGEITGHIDMAVKFLDQDTLLVASSGPEYKYHGAFEAMAGMLAGQKSASGAGYRIVRMPMPALGNSSRKLWSYVNSLTLNRKLIIPVFNRPEDQTALEIYRSVMPGYEISAVDMSCYPVGSVHCQTRELPEIIFPGTKP